MGRIKKNRERKLWKGEDVIEDKNEERREKNEREMQVKIKG